MKRYAILILCLCLLAACGGSDDSSNDKELPNKGTPKYKINYSIDTYCPAQGDIIFQSMYYQKTIQNVILSWGYEFMAQEGDYLYLKISNLKRLPSNEICENQNILFDIQISISINNKVFKHISCYADNDAPSSIDNCEVLILEGIVP